jgi:hypothetical protein
LMITLGGESNFCGCAVESRPRCGTIDHRSRGSTTEFRRVLTMMVIMGMFRMGMVERENCKIELERERGHQGSSCGGEDAECSAD